MSLVRLNMESQTYKYFETGNITDNNGISNINPHNDLKYVSDPSLESPPFWQIFPHLLGFIFIWAFVSIFFNTYTIWFFPTFFFFPILIIIFILIGCLFGLNKQMFCGFINTLSHGFWIGIIFYILGTLLNELLPYILGYNDNNSDGYKQIKYIFTSLFLTAFIEECLKYYLCNKSYILYFKWDPAKSISDYPCMILYCISIGLGIGISKGLISLALIGNPNQETCQCLFTPSSSDNNSIHFRYACCIDEDFRYALLNYVVKPYMIQYNDHEWALVILYSFIIVPFHAVLGSLWGVQFVRRYLLDHYISFGQMVMFPWIFHALVNLIISEIFYNVPNMDPNFENKSVWIPISIVIPFLFTIIGIAAFALIFKRKVGTRSFRKRMVN